jgi:nitrite reductase/ring-hydroxylating ferredoxin subunit/DMSO/TMAO reductase YedYZ heme-binding membrane subunit
MSVGYVAVQWNRQKKIYDLVLWSFIVVFLVLFITLEKLIHPLITDETAIIRATALVSFILLHLVLIIGPLCRIDDRFLPLLYNRRHLGVSLFLIASVHGIFSILQFHSLGNTSTIMSVFTSNVNYRNISEFPFQTLGFISLVILFVMAITSHDFWLKNLSPWIWKSLHMLVYLAYALIILHVATGALQYESHPLYWVLLVTGLAIGSSLHILAGLKENKKLKRKNSEEDHGFYRLGKFEDLVDNRALTANIEGKQIAIFRYGDKVSAVESVCKHQLGPIGEGQIIDGCITCPWHGHQYRPEDGQSPPPFDERLDVYSTKLIDGMIWVNPLPVGRLMDSKHSFNDK